jgi:hypothetical protein
MVIRDSRAHPAAGTAAGMNGLEGRGVPETPLAPGAAILAVNKNQSQQ